MAHVLVIGAGIVGAALAARLSTGGRGWAADAAHDTRVTVVDDQGPGHGTSASSLAWLNANHTKDPAYFAFRIAALQEWDHLAAQLADPPWYSRNGNVEWAETETARAELTERVERLRARDYAARFVTASEVRAIQPDLQVPSDALIAYFPTEGFVHGGEASRALLGLATRNGASVVTGDPVVGLCVRHGSVTGVRLASGVELDADVTVCAAGWRTPEVLASVGHTIPIEDVHAPRSPAPCVVATTTAVPGALRVVVHAPQINLRPDTGGTVLLEAADLDAATEMTTASETLRAWADELLDRARTVLPPLSRAEVATARRCVRPLPLDGFPLVGWLTDGCYVAVTHSGITLGPHLARLAAAEIITREAAPELAAYRPTRPMARSSEAR